MKTKNPKENSDLTAGSHLSYWTDSAAPPPEHPLKENLETDVVIVGGGLAGLSVAYCLIQSGLKVVVAEDGNIGSGETGRTTAHLVSALDDRYYELVRLFGKDKTKLIAQSHQTAIDFVEDVIKKEKIECGFERLNGYLFLHPSDKEDSLQREKDAAETAGVKVEEVKEVPGLREAQAGLCFPDQAQFHPLRYLYGLCRAIEKKGGKIYTGTHASVINYKGIVTSAGNYVNARFVVVATNSPVNSVFTMSVKQFAYRTYAIGCLIKKGILPAALWWDTGDFDVNPNTPPYHYVRIHPFDEEHDLLISGGEDHPTGDTSQDKIAEEDRYRIVEQWTRNHFPVTEVKYRWSGQVMEPMDGIAFIGRNPFDHDNVFIVTGDSGNGMTHCSFAGLLITDLINGKENKWEKLYSPSRLTFKATGSAFKEFMQGLLSYLKTVPGSVPASALSEVATGEGKIVELGKEKYGVYRNEEGKLTIVSAECTHLNCIVSWNRDEKSWDCPCHGSRFSFEGIVINGPANEDLSLYREDD